MEVFLLNWCLICKLFLSFLFFYGELNVKAWVLSIQSKILEIPGEELNGTDIFWNIHVISESGVFLTELSLCSKKLCSIRPFLLGSSSSNISWLCYFGSHGKLVNGTGLFSIRLRVTGKLMQFHSPRKVFGTSNWNVLLNGKHPLV